MVPTTAISYQDIVVAPPPNGNSRIWLSGASISCKYDVGRNAGFQWLFRIGQADIDGVKGAERFLGNHNVPRSEFKLIADYGYHNYVTTRFWLRQQLCAPSPMESSPRSCKLGP